MHRQNSKQRHDFKNVILLIKELIRDEQYNKATEMIDKTVKVIRTIILPRL